MSELIDKNHFHKRFLKEWEWCEKRGFDTQPLEYVEELINTEPSAQPTLYGYSIEHLALIANALKKENLPPEKVADALMDIGRIIDIVRNEFEESLRKAVELCVI